MQRFKDNLFSIIGWLLFTITFIIYQHVKGKFDLKDVLAILGVFTIFYTYLLFIIDLLFYKSKRENDNFKEDINELLSKFDEKYIELSEIEKNIKEATDILIKKQQIIDQKLLGLIEKQAQEVWVITTSLATEIGDKNLQNDIIDNFRNKPNLRYTYFIPHPDSSFDEVQSNLKSFKELEFYKDFQDRIDIIPLSVETQFLLEEVVIYNPHGRYLDIENDKDYSGINGFTYYNQDGKNLHMKLDINMLKHLKSNLEKKLSGTGLTLAIEKIFTKYDDLLSAHQQIYLSTLIKESSIHDKGKYEDFVESFDNKHPIEAIKAFLGRFITFGQN